MMNIFYICLFAVWLIICSWLGKRILIKLLPLPSFLILFLSLFVPIFLLGLIANIFTSWLMLTDLSVIASFLIVLLILSVTWLITKSLKVIGGIESNEEHLWHWPWALSLLFDALLIAGAYFLFNSVSGSNLTSPWQTISIFYLPIVFTLLFASLIVAYSDLKISKALILIILVSLLTHSYLLVYKNGFGGDRWRHLASENRILAGLEYQPTLLSNNIWQSKILGLNVPRALVDPAKTSYGLAWSLEIIAAKITSRNVSTINKTLLPIIWSIFLPLIMAAIAGLVLRKKSFILLTAALSNFLYLLQYYGGQGLPASYGLLWWLFMLLLWVGVLKAANADTPHKTNIKYLATLTIFLSILMYFNYSLSFILTVVSGLAVLAYLNKARILKYARFIILPVWPLFIFLIEYLVNKNNLRLNDPIAFWRDGNLIYFNLLNYLSAWPILNKILAVLILMLFAALLVGLRKGSREQKYLTFLFYAYLCNYFLCWTLLSGPLIIARRLTLFIAPLLVLAISYTAYVLIKNNQKKALAAMVLLSLIGLVAFRSGPVLSVSVSDLQLNTANFIWEQIKNDYQDYNILAPENILLPLEAVSAKQMVNGNFLTQDNYVETDRARLMNDFLSGQIEAAANEAKTITKTGNCLIIISQKQFEQSFVDKADLKHSLLEKGQLINDYMIFKY